MDVHAGIQHEAATESLLLSLRKAAQMPTGGEFWVLLGGLMIFTIVLGVVRRLMERQRSKRFPGSERR